MSYLLRHIMMLLTILLLLSACTQEEITSGGGNGIPDNSPIPIELFARTQDFSTPIVSRGIIDNEGVVDNTPWILVFKGNDNNAVFVEAAKSYRYAGIKKTYVDLTPQTETCKILILANLGDSFYLKEGNNYIEKSTSPEDENNNFNMVLNGKTLSEACAMLYAEPVVKDNEGNERTTVPFIGESLVMNQVYIMPSISTGMKLGEETNKIELNRTVAKIVIKNTDANYTFQGIMVIGNVPRRTLLHNLNGTLPTLSDNDKIRYKATSGYIAEAVVQSTETNPVYLYESAIANNSYIIIKGNYNSVDYYYKMAIVDSYKNPLNILRNHEYIFTITNVGGRGYDTVEDAIASKAANIDLDFKITVTDLNAYEIMANNDYYMAVSNSLFIAYYDPPQNDEESYRIHLPAFTLITDCKVNFPISKTISLDTNEDWKYPQWKNNSFYLINSSDNVEWNNRPDGHIDLPTVTENTSNPLSCSVSIMLPSWTSGWSGGAEYILLKLGNLEKRVYVRHNPAISASGGIVNVRPYDWDWDWRDGTENFNSGEVVDEYNTNAKNWIKLRPKDNNGDIIYDRSITDQLTVDNGRIAIEVTKNTSTEERKGIVYLTTTNATFDIISQKSIRIKVLITQLGSL